MTESASSTPVTTPAGWCGHCGRPAGDHPRCAEALRMEPPRFCAACGRRMKVQVSPTSWTARCVEHGVVES